MQNYYLIRSIHKLICYEYVGDKAIHYINRPLSAKISGSIIIKVYLVPDFFFSPVKLI